MRKIQIALSAFLLMFGAYLSSWAQTKFTGKLDPVSAILEARVGKRFVAGEIIVKRKPGLPGRMTAEAVSPLGLEPVERNISGGETLYRIAPGVMSTLSVEAQRDRTLSAVTALRAMPDVQYAQPNYIYRILDTTPNDVRYPEQWHYLKSGSGAGSSPGGIGLPIVWGFTRGSATVVVAVIDTGILPNHPDIVGSPNLVAGYDMISDPFMANDGDGRDPDPTDPGDAVNAGECGGGWPPSNQPSSWHGTHVAGTIGVGNTNNAIGVAGINWNVKVQPIRVLGKCGGTTADIADAIRWAAGFPIPDAPNNTTKARVINMSLGGVGACSDDPVTQNAINDAVGQGVTVVVAAGNSAENASLETPSGCNNVIAVAASDWRGFMVTRYSNFGAAVKIMAPGGDVQRDDNGDGNPDGVLSMVSPADGTYAYYNGTSMASPHVAGVAALLLSCEPTLTPAQILDRLQSTALPRTSAQCPNGCGAGLLNAAAAIGTCGVLPPSLISLALSPVDSKLRPNGDHETITATVTQGPATRAGETVTFSSDNTTVATVSPASAVTDNNGQAGATVTAHNKGDAQVHASAGGTNAQAHVKVPLLSPGALVVLFVAAIVVYLQRLRQERRI